MANQPAQTPLPIAFQDPTILARLREYFETNVAPFEVTLEALNLVRNYEYFLHATPHFAATAPGLAQAYETLITRARWVALPALKEPEIIELLAKHFVDAFSLPEYNVWAKLKAKLVAIFLYEDRDKFKQELRTALESNQQLLTTAPFTLGSKSDAPSVANWIRDYHSQIGVGPSDAVRQNEYLVGSLNAKGLSDEERERIRTLIQFYERLKLSSEDPQGIEESYSVNLDGTWKTLHGGVWEEIRKGDVKALAERAVEVWRQVVLGEEAPPATSSAVAAKPTQPAATPSTAPLVAPKLAVVSKETSRVAAPVALQSPGPALIFDLEDEREADKFRGQEAGVQGLEKQLRMFADEMIKKNNLSFKDDANRRRFVNLFVSRLKDVRSPIDVRESLQKPTEAGGLGMLSETVEKVLSLIEQARVDWGTRAKQTVPEPVMAAPNIPPPAPMPAVPSKPTRQFDSQAAEVWRQQVLDEIEQRVPSPARASVATAAEAAVGSSTTAPARPTLADVKAPPKVVGPLEELKSLTLIDFRRLGPRPTEALTKVRAKLDLIGETSLARRFEAIRAWQASAVYQLYLALGRQSIEQGKSIGQLVAERQALGQPTLSEEEFNAIVDFNAKLRF